MLEVWLNEIRRARPDAVYVFCSEGAGASDPPGEPAHCSRYRLIGNGEWRPLPSSVSVPHPFRAGYNEASAFIVQGILYPIDSFEAPTIEWFSLNGGPWRHEKLPTRGEYLIRVGRGERMRKCRAVLILQDPYVAVVSRGGI